MNIEYKVPVLYWSTSRLKDKEEMEKSYSCIMIFISRTRNILLASRVVPLVFLLPETFKLFDFQIFWL